MDFQYVGQEFSPTPMSEPVTYYVSRTDVPVGQYGIIGKATIIAPDGTDGFDIQELLLQRAREYGADAVCQVKAERIKVGTYPFSSDEFSGPSSAYNPANLNPDGSFIAENTFGDTVEVKSEIRNRYKVEVKALFLKNKKQLTALLEERGRELDQLLAEPGVVDDKSVPETEVVSTEKNTESVKSVPAENSAAETDVDSVGDML